MKRFILFLFLLSLIKQAHFKLPELKRQELLSKLTKKISLENIDEWKKLNFISNQSPLEDGISYDPAQIEQILEENGFPQNYNFIEETNATVNIKDQASCGCCWSHAATTALAYRYHTKGVEVDLSPQDGLSCYIKDCDVGNNLIDPELNLIKNGTVTEGCLPFSSIDGKTIEPCPTSCKDGSKYEKYYAKNAYMTQDYYTEDTFYEIVTLIIDELIENGPIVSGIIVYDDFMDLCKNPQKCHDTVYRYDGTSQNPGGHAVVIVGYGYLKGQFYWLIQNSWGEKACDKGFVKIEFGQIRVESVAFAEPYIPNEQETPVEIPVSLKNMDTLCYFDIVSPSSKDLWKNTLDIRFKHSNVERNFDYQCGKKDIINTGKIIKCYYEIKNYHSNKGIYEFNNAQSLGIENKFIIDDSFKIKFQFWGFDTIDFYNINLYFISEEGSRMTFYYESDDESLLPPIYANKGSSTPLSDCHRINGLPLVYCEIKKNELSYFKYYNQQPRTPMVHNILCGYKQPFIYAYLLNKNDGISLRIKNFTIPEEDLTINYNTKLTVVAEYDGDISLFNNDENLFINFVNVDYNNKNITYEILCNIDKKYISGKNLNMVCVFMIDKSLTIKYDDIYLLPYYVPYDMLYQYEVIIKETIKCAKGKNPDPKPVPSFSKHLKSSIGFILVLFILF